MSDTLIVKEFTSEQFGNVRTAMIDGAVWFVGKDVAKALGYGRATKAIRDHVDSEDSDEVPIRDSIGRMQNTPIINESGLYSLVLSSKLPAAKQFKHWIENDHNIVVQYANIKVTIATSLTKLDCVRYEEDNSNKLVNYPSV